MKIQVGVFFGGKSVEHEVSVITGLQAFAALDREKYDPVPIYITKQGLLYTGPRFADIEAYKDIPLLLSSGTQLVLAPADGRTAMVRHPARRVGNNVIGYLDVALPAVHGTNVEDGVFQGYLDTLGLPYAGPDVPGAALCMDKAASKTLLQNANIPVLPALAISAADWAERPEEETRQIEAEFVYPVMVKPVNLGSSIGISRAPTREALHRALDLSFKFSARALVEPAIVNLREINCSVLGDARAARPSVCEEPVSGDEILSYRDKYLSSGKQGGMGGARRRIPAELTDEESQIITTLAVKTFQLLGCRGVARVDFLLDDDTGNIYVNEINAIPGSLAYYLWEPTGLNFSALLDELLSLAFQRKREQEALSFTYESNLLSGVGFGGKKTGR
ncbi:MAG: D-alanine--D-alanine ligase [Oscillospiraceae bacterium]|jgi:D-alanine-D-alanine ligase|nr:D-alanine--D-alanine ligase [Oscillospiraceae bacterium]